MMKKFWITFFSLMLINIFYQDANAKITFLPDYEEGPLYFGGLEDNSECSQILDEYGNNKYHLGETCIGGKVFDEYCPYDNSYISECYCPDIFSYSCEYPMRGDTRFVDSASGHSSCDGLWVECCDTTCPPGTTLEHPGGCGGHTYNSCGDACYYPYEDCCDPMPDDSNCSCGTERCSDGCGGSRLCCKECLLPDDDDDDDKKKDDNDNKDENGNDDGIFIPDNSDAMSSSSSSSSSGAISCVDGGSLTCYGGVFSASACPNGVAKSCTDCNGLKHFTCK
ncbi:MAG: hypothetical protein IJX20_04770 [Alphaproteobacteria bacterium]|nr:hypothetical protein [Alphaproteobacteria bacterium]